MNLRSGKCPKCGGPFQVARYLGQWYADCILCGYLRFLEEHAPGSDADSMGAVDKRAEARVGLRSSKQRH